MKVVQGIYSDGFGGLEMVILEFHEWLISKGIPAYVLAEEGTPLEKQLLARGHRDTTLSVDKKNTKEINRIRKSFDSKKTAMLFHRQQGLKDIAFQNFTGKVSLLSHTFYEAKKKDIWHRFVFSNVDQWIALTKTHKENLIETTGVADKKVSIIPNGVPLDKFPVQFKELPGSDQTIKIGVIARLDPQKGQDIALFALKDLLTQSDRKFSLHFFGEDTPNEAPFKPTLEDICSVFGLEDHVVFHGFQDNMSESISKMDILWMPSFKETFGRCVIEGMASGVPVIASNAGGVPDIITDQVNGVLFETKNPDDLSQKTLSLIQNPNLFKSIQQKARQDVEQKYNQEKIWRRLVETILPDQCAYELKSRLDGSFNFVED
jgi:glycosyltransferase involved in cell wall biosynthesis